MTLFRDRPDAGRLLAQLLSAAGIAGDGVVVLGLPRGGVPVAAEVARSLGAQLDVIIVRKLGVPSQPELAMGAIGEDGILVRNEEILRSAGLDTSALDAVERRERLEVVRRARSYREGRVRLDLRESTAVVVDDGVATGSTARAACRVARAHGASRIVLAVPVAPEGAGAALRDACDDFLCLANPEPFYAVGEWYDDFSPIPESEVVESLRRAAQP